MEIASDTPYTSTGTTDLPLMLLVTAPATLPAGYTFEAEINGDPTKLFTCEVPEGGVEGGQVFLAPLSRSYDRPRLIAPTGHWKDNLYDCFAAGISHPSLWCSWCCSQIALGQIMTRMQLTWLGGPGPLDLTRQTFGVVVFLVVLGYGFSLLLSIELLDGSLGTLLLWLMCLDNCYERNLFCTLQTRARQSIAVVQYFLVGVLCWFMLVPELSFPHVNHKPYFCILGFVGVLSFVLWTIYALARTRKAMRVRYQIPEHQCAGCEDVCCAFWCGCCVTAQMMRHTGEYENYNGVCCSSTGHPPGTPIVV